MDQTYDVEITSDIQIGAFTQSFGNVTFHGGNLLRTVPSAHFNARTAYVQGPGTEFQSTESIFVGNPSGAMVEVNSGGNLYSGAETKIGDNANSTGSVTVRDNGSQLINDGNLWVGNMGSGFLNIENGGFYSSAVFTTAYVGFSGSATGQVTITGSGSQWNGSSVEIGRRGNGTLLIENGGSLIDAVGRVGSSIGSTGSATVNGNGSRWENTSHLFVGDLVTQQ